MCKHFVWSQLTIDAQKDLFAEAVLARPVDLCAETRAQVEHGRRNQRRENGNEQSIA